MQFIGSLQKKYSIGSFDLLAQTAPVQAASLIVVGPFADYILVKENILYYQVTAMGAVSHFTQLTQVPGHRWAVSGIIFVNA